jgi:hypothetical protein
LPISFIWSLAQHSRRSVKPPDHRGRNRQAAHRRNDADLVRLTTRFRGSGMCLDIFNGGPNDNQPHLVNCANLSGQLWTLTKTDKRVESATKNN